MSVPMKSCAMTEEPEASRLRASLRTAQCAVDTLQSALDHLEQRLEWCRTPSRPGEDRCDPKPPATKLVDFVAEQERRVRLLTDRIGRLLDELDV